MRPSTRQLCQLVEQERANDLPLRVERTIYVDANRLFTTELDNESITKVKIPKRWGTKWTLTMSQQLYCSYALNRKLCRWFKLPKDELALIHLYPMVDNYLTAFVWDAPADTFCIETLPWRIDHLASQLSQLFETWSLYPRLLNSSFRCVNNPLIDLLFVECAADADISSATIKLDFVFHPTGLVTIQMDTAAAILLDAGSAERNALYAVPLSDEFELQCEPDVAAYMRRLVAWADEGRRSPCPATWVTADCHVVDPLAGFQLYLWTIRVNFIYF